MVRFPILAALLIAAHAASAAPACTTARNYFDGLYCLAKIYQQSDRALNVVYARLNAKLSAAAQPDLAADQKSWMAQRDAACMRRDTDGVFVNLTCATRTTQDRDKMLRARLAATK